MAQATKNYEISSDKNEIFRKFKDLLTRKGIAEHHEALIFGQKATTDAMLNWSKRVSGVIKSPAMILSHELLQVPKFYTVSNPLFEKLDIFGSGQPILLVDVPIIETWDSKLNSEGCSLYLPFQDPNNVGAVIRSAAAFGVNRILLGPQCAHPFHPRSTRAASSFIFSQRYFKTSVSEIQSNGLPVLALDRSGQKLSDFKFPKNFILVPGLEGPGLPDEFKESKKIAIEMDEKIDSLNVSVATSIALYKWFTK